MDPQGMIHFVGDSGNVSDRKLRLFAAACCRRVWHLLQDRRSRKAVDVAECYADGLATPEELDSAAQGARASAEAARRDPATRGYAVAIAGMAGSGNYVAADAAVFAASEAAIAIEFLYRPAEAACYAVLDSWESESAAQAGLLRDIFGPAPFRLQPPLAQSLLTWRGGFIAALAQAAYDNRRFPSGHLDLARLAVLADGLEDAGCQDAQILGHLRGPGPHVRGCYVVDLVLGII
jgi:hypothetical protein